MTHVVVLAHGVGERADLPLPVWMVAYGAAAVLVLSFVALAALWPRARFEARTFGRPLPAPLDRGLRALEWPLRILGAVAATVVFAAALAGPLSTQQNIAPYAVYVILWTGGMFVSGLVGDLWGVLSPFETTLRLTGGVPGNPGNPSPVATRPAAAGEADDAETPLFERLGLWPAAVTLFAFAWLELVHPTPGDPPVLARAIGGYLVIMSLGAIWLGRGWLRSAEAFGAFFRILAAMAPFHRGDDGRLRVRPPLVGLAGLEVVPGTAAVVLVALGSTTFDGITRLTAWESLVGDRTGWAAVPIGTLGLVGAIALVAGIYVWAMSEAAARTSGTTRGLVNDFVHSLVPIALGYAVAHYFSLLVFESQRVAALASDPLGFGWDLFGTADWTVNYAAMSPNAIAWVQAGAIVAGHLAGVLLAHDRAVARYEGRQATRSQYALLVAMVAYTVGGLFLLLGA